MKTPKPFKAWVVLVEDDAAGPVFTTRQLAREEAKIWLHCLMRARIIPVMVTPIPTKPRRKS